MPISLRYRSRFNLKHSSNPQLVVAKYILVGLELPPSQRSPRQGREEVELSPLQGAQNRPCSVGVEVNRNFKLNLGAWGDW
jgi:hypothetical protein